MEECLVLIFCRQTLASQKSWGKNKAQTKAYYYNECLRPFFDVVAGCLLTVFYYTVQDFAHKLFLMTTISTHMCNG